MIRNKQMMDLMKALT